VPSLIPGFEYDIFISYRQKDNKYDGWVTEFVDNLKKELEATFKEEISVYFDINPHDGLLETHDVDASLKDKFKCLVFIPIISRTYCDPKSFAWEHEFKAFVEQASQDQFGLKVKLPGGNVASRVLPVRIYDLDNADIKLCESVLGGMLRSVEFIYKSSGVNRPLRSKEENPQDNLNHTIYRDQINKVGNAIKEIISGLKTEPVELGKEKPQVKEPLAEVRKEERKEVQVKPAKLYKRNLLIGGIVLAVLLIIAAVFAYPKIFKHDTLEKLRLSGERISIAVMPFQNMTNDTTWNIWQDGIQNELITSLTNSEELRVRQTESINNLIQSKGLTDYASITPSVASNISQKLDAYVYIYGSIKQVGKTTRISAQLIDSKTNEIFKSFQVDGSSDRIMHMIDSLSGEIKNSLVISKLEKEVTADFQPYGSTTTSEAYQNFIYGQNAFMKLDYQTAILFFHQALGIDSTFTYATLLLALAYGNSGDIEHAKEITLRAHSKRDQIPSQQLKIFADFIYAVYFETPIEQIKYIRQWDQIDDQLPFNKWNLGRIYNEFYQYDKAIPEFNQALAIYKKWGVKPAWIDNYILLGYAYHKTGQYKKERKLYNKAEHDFPDNLYLIYRQSVLAFSQKEVNASNEYIKKYISANKGNASSDADIKSSLARIYDEADIPEKAEEYFRQALLVEPENPIRLNSLAWLLISRDRNINEGLEFINKALVLKPDDYSFLDTKGWGLFKQGKYSEALELIQKSWDLKPVYDHRVYLHLEAAKKAVASQKNN
jgi:tetratricopeptide (TPR) repeat protein